MFLFKIRWESDIRNSNSGVYKAPDPPPPQTGEDPPPFQNPAKDLEDEIENWEKAIFHWDFCM